MKVRKTGLPTKKNVKQLLSKKKLPEDIVFLSQFVKELDFKRQGPLVHRSYRVIQALYTVWRMKLLEEDVKEEFNTVEWGNLEKAKENLKYIVKTHEDHCKLSSEQREEVIQLLKSNPLYYEAACMAEDVYFDTAKALSGGWKRSDDFADLMYRDIQGCGLKSRLYERQGKNGKDYVYATAGTNPFDDKDWQNNLFQVVGHSPQYDLALSVAKQLSMRISNNDTLTFVGHSLGGGEATNNALATGHPAIVFNPAGLSQTTMIKSQADASLADSLVTTFITDNDVLNWMQDCASHIKVWNLLVPTSIGHKYYLPMSQNSRIGHNMPPIVKFLKATYTAKDHIDDAARQ